MDSREKLNESAKPLILNIYIYFSQKREKFVQRYSFEILRWSVGSIGVQTHNITDYVRILQIQCTESVCVSVCVEFYFQLKQLEIITQI